jgi:phenylpropionate dioxygenase-like ring-hydroxylating dioxygenase large terminal subunit
VLNKESINSIKGEVSEGMLPQWVVSSNWKLTLENFRGDPYHVATAHSSTVELGIVQVIHYIRYVYQVVLNYGYSINVNSATLGRNMPKFQGLPEEKNLIKEQHDILGTSTVFVGTK